MSSEKFCLKWNDFEANISGAFRELRDDKDFFDVTLACDDDQINAHKVILSACSPFFRTVLRRNPHQHPLLYMKGVRYTDLQSVLTFMYHGEVNIAQDDLNNFLAVAEDLRVKGLTQNTSSSSKPPHSEPASSVRPKLPDRVVTRPAAAASEDDDIQEVLPVKAEPLPSQLQQLDQFGGDTGQYEEEGFEHLDQYDDSAMVEGAGLEAKGEIFHNFHENSCLFDEYVFGSPTITLR